MHTINSRTPLESAHSAVAELLSEGIAAAQSGDNAVARTLLLQVTDQAPDNETAWLWLASIVELPEHRLAFLERALGINPHNEQAQAWMQAARANRAVVVAKRHCRRARRP